MMTVIYSGIDLNRFTARWKMTEGMHSQATDGVIVTVIEPAVEVLVEILKGGVGLDRVAVGSALENERPFVEVVLVLDLTNDLLEHVLDRDHAGGAAILVDDDRHMVAARPKLAQQHV